MSFSTIASSSADRALSERITAATVSEAWNNATAGDTEYGRNVRAATMNAIIMIYPVCVASDVEAAYESALAAGNPNPGGDEAVITDGMILANVQAKWPQDEAP
jgi:hypothetical protein